MNFIIQIVKAVTIALVVLIALVAFVAFMGASGRDAVDTVKTDVANDFERQYQDAKSFGSPVDWCVRAGLVAEGHLQAGNRTEYATWKEIERADCAAAGVTR